MILFVNRDVYNKYIEYNILYLLNNSQLEMNEFINREIVEEDNIEINLTALFKTLWREKISILLITLFASILSVFIALSIPNKYQSQALIAPVEGDSSLDSLNRQYGGLASLAGVSLGEGSANKSQIGIETMLSRKFIGKIVTDRNILIPLMASSGWNKDLNKIVINQNIYNSSLNKWVRSVNDLQMPKPSEAEIHEYWMKNIFSFTENKVTGFITIRVKHYSPFIARDLLNWIIEDINETIRDQDIKEAELAIDFLNKEIAVTESEELRSLLFKLLQSQTETKMLAYSKKDYIFKIIDPPFVPYKKSSPYRALLCIMGALIGGFLGIIFVLIQDFFLKKRNYQSFTR